MKGRHDVRYFELPPTKKEYEMTELERMIIILFVKGHSAFIIYVSSNHMK